MTRTWSAFKMGSFVLGAVALVVAAIGAFGLSRHLHRTLRFETYVAGSVDGLTVGSPVKLKGVAVGEVAEIGFSWNEYPGGSPPCVVIRFTVLPGVLPGPAAGDAVQGGAGGGLRATVETQGITGIATLSLDVGGEPAAIPPLAYSWTPRDPVIPSAPGQLSTILSTAQAALARLEQLDVARLQASLDRTLRSADEAAQAIGRFDAARLSRDLSSAVASARAAARDVSAVAGAARAKLEALPTEELAREADGALAALRTSSERLGRLVDRFSGVDVQDVNATLASARRAAQELDEAIVQLRRYPSGFLFGSAPPPARSVEAER